MKKIIIILSIIGFVFMIGVFGFLYYKNLPVKIWNLSQNTVTEKREDMLQGKILMSLATEGVEYGNPIAYQYDFRNKELTESKTPINESGEVSLKVSYSPDFSYKTFIAASDFYDAENPNTKGFQVFKQFKSNVQRVTNNSYKIKALPSINNLGNILYAKKNATKDEAPLHIYAEYFAIYMIDEQGVEKYIDDGYDPKWVSDTEFLYFKNTAIYFRDLKNSKPVVILGLSELGLSPTQYLEINTHINVSRNGDLLAVTNLDNGNLSIYKLIIEDTSAKTEFIKSVKISGFWPVFSPDGEYVALQTVDLANIDSNPRPRLLIYSLPNLEKLSTEIDLSNFYQDYMFINDWIK